MKTTRYVALAALFAGFVLLVIPARASAEIVRVTFAGVLDLTISNIPPGTYYVLCWP